MYNLFVIRGLPGSGKSTFAQRLVDKCMAKHFEADMFFIKDELYLYDKSKIGEAHKWCQDKVKEAMLTGDNIVVSNTFVKRWEIEPYLLMAKDNHYVVTEITMSGPLRGNIHGVPDEVINRMKANWEI
jgi:predicted kinase